MSSNASMLPFTCHFAQPLPNQPAGPPVRYIVERQVSQVLVDGAWIDALDFPAPLQAGTRITRTHQESTDDR